MERTHHYQTNIYYESYFTTNSKTMQKFKIIIALLAIALADMWQIQAQVVLQGNFVEVGVGSCGTYGTDYNAIVPPGYHNNVGPFLGFVADVGQDGWTAGSPAMCGDYFVPGTPEEGWGVEFNSNNYGAFQLCFPSEVTGISGGSVANTSVPGTQSATFTGLAGASGELAVTQLTRYPDNALYFVTDVTLTNVSGVTLNNVYYFRNVDPDNSQVQCGSYTTKNTIADQFPGSSQALVTATGAFSCPDCFMGIGSLDPRAVVSYGGFSNRIASDVYNGLAGLTTTMGLSNTADDAISIAFFFGDMAPDETVCFSFAHVLDPTQLASALATTAGPTIWANGNNVTGGSVNGTGGVNLSIQGGAGCSWTWSPAVGLSGTTGTNVTATPPTSTTYTATGVCPCGIETLTVDVEVSSNCVTVVNDTVYCEDDTVKYTFSILNNTITNFPIDHFNINLPAGVSFTPSGPYHPTPNPLPPTATSTPITVQINNAAPLSTLCFTLTAHDADSLNCCTDTLQHCIVIPVCDDCCNDFFDEVLDADIVCDLSASPSITLSCPTLTNVPNWVEWDYECDGTPDATSNPYQTPVTHTFPPGTHVVCMTAYRIVEGDTCRVKQTKVIEIPEDDCCDINSFPSDVAAGFSTSFSYTTGTFTPNSLKSCDQVEWLWGDGSPNSFSAANNPIPHTFPGYGNYFVCMVVTRYDLAGNICEVLEYCANVWVPWVIICDPWYDDFTPLDFDGIISGGTVVVDDPGDGTLVLTPDAGLAGCETLTWTITGSVDTTVVSMGGDSIVINYPGTGYLLNIEVDVVIENSNYVSNFGDTVSDGCPDPPVLTITDELCDTINNTLNYQFEIDGCLPSYQLAVETDNQQGMPVLSSNTAVTDFSVTFTDTMEVGTVATVYVLDGGGNPLTELEFEPDAGCVRGNPICIADAGDIDEQKIYIRTINYSATGVIGTNHWLVLTDATGIIRDNTGSYTPPATGLYSVCSYAETTPTGTTFPINQHIDDQLPTTAPSPDFCYDVVCKELCFIDYKTYDVLCKGDNDGRIEILEECGGDYLYLWDNGNTGKENDGLPAGEYSVTVTDGSGNTASASIVIEEPDEELMLTIADVTNLSSLGANDGTVTFSVSGGTAPYTYNLESSDGEVFDGSLAEAGDTTITGLPEGEYILAVIDNNGEGCVATVDTITILSPPDGINDETGSPLDEFTLAPNPASEQVTVAYRASQAGEPVSIALYDYTGKLLYRQESLPPTGTINLATNALPNGSYFVAIEQNGIMEAKPLLIAR